LFFADWRKAVKKRIKLRAARLATKIAQLRVDFASTAMDFVSTKVERMYQIHIEKAQMRLAPSRPDRSCPSILFRDE
jgi:hypothetical protein